MSRKNGIGFFRNTCLSEFIPLKNESAASIFFPAALRILPAGSARGAPCLQRNPADGFVIYRRLCIADARREADCGANDYNKNRPFHYAASFS